MSIDLKELDDDSCVHIIMYNLSHRYLGDIEIQIEKCRDYTTEIIL